MTDAKVIQLIQNKHLLIVFPIQNRRDPPSLWHALHPRSEMRWEWNEDGDRRVETLWHQRGRISHSGQIFYSKWFRGRATVMSLDMTSVLITLLQAAPPSLSSPAQDVLDFLREDSPRSPRQIKAECGLQGRLMERYYERALKELWQRLYITGYGEIDDGAFPSLALGATSVLFENIWTSATAAAKEPTAIENAHAFFQTHGSSAAFVKYLKQLLQLKK